MADLEVGDADRARTPVPVEGLQRLPRRHVVAVVERREGPVDQEQVDVVHAQRGQRAVERPARVVGPVEAVVELAGDVQLVPVEAGGGHRLADPLLVAVHLRRVDVPVADLERGAHRLRGLGRLDLEDAEPELGDRATVVEVDRRYGAHGVLPLLRRRCVVSAQRTIAACSSTERRRATSEEHAAAWGSWRLIRAEPAPHLRQYVTRYTGWWERTAQAVRRTELPAIEIPVILSFGPPDARARHAAPRGTARAASRPSWPGSTRAP